jgi:ribosome-associated heat shock protein Hsp15
VPREETSGWCEKGQLQPDPRVCERTPVDAVRVDKWLWAARFFKTRGAATEAVLGGHVQVNGVRVKPAREVVVGDRLEITRSSERWTVVVVGLADRRGPASVAATLYDETPESAEERQRRRNERRLARPLGADLSARPTKRDRRRLDALRRAQRRNS